MKKKGIHLLATAMTLVLVTTVAAPVTAEAASPRPAVSGSSKITKGKRVQFSVKYKKKRVSAKSCKWYSTKKSVATVSRSGKVTAKKAGTTYIYVKYKGRKSAKKKVTVKNPAPKISRSRVTLTKGKSITLKVTGTKKKPKWSSSKKSVAVVSRSGRVTAKKAGTAKITAKIGKKKYTCKVTVKNPAKPAVKPKPPTPVKPTEKPSISEPKPPVSEPKPPVSKPDDCIQESDHNWVEQPGGTHRYYETIVKEAVTYDICRACGYAIEDRNTMYRHHSTFGPSFTTLKRGPEIYRDDIDHSETYKCSKCGKTKTEKWTEKGKETLRVYTLNEEFMFHLDPGACAAVWCPVCKDYVMKETVEESGGYCIMCPIFNGKETYLGDDWRDKIVYPWDIGQTYINWDKSGREMVYEPESKTWKYTGR